MTSSLVRGDRGWRLAGAVVVAYAALGIAYGLVNPLFESPDEFYHYEYVRYLVDRRALPPVIGRVVVSPPPFRP